MYIVWALRHSAVPIEMNTMSLSQTTKELASELGETQPDPLDQIKLVVRKLGPDEAKDLLTQARQLDALGNEQTADGSRQRSLGGLFFRLARNRLGHPLTMKRIRRLKWEQAAEIAREATEGERGEVPTVKIVLIGRPGQIVKRESVVVTTMYNHKRPSLPKQLPKMSGADVETPYTVFITAKHWRKVSEALEDKEDKLVVEGYPFLDPDVKGICVFAKFATTTGMQRAEREKQRNEAQSGGAS